MADSSIKREILVDPSVIPPLDESILTLSKEESDFLHNAITPDDVELKKRILEVQEIAYAQHPYPCIRAFHFVNMMMSSNPIYPSILEAGKSGNTIFIDLGCCLGTDVRKLVADGYPGRNVLGTDVRQEFLDIGYKLYQDSSSSNPIRFFTSDIFDVPSPPSLPLLPSTTKEPPQPLIPLSETSNLTQLKGRINHIYLGALFHLFNESTQYEIALRVASLLDLSRKEGVVVFGRHQGLEVAGIIDDHLGRDRYGHSTESWKTLWKQIFTQLKSAEFANTNVIVDAVLKYSFDIRAIPAREKTYMLVWSVRIV